MSAIATVVDGKVTNQTSSTDAANKSKTSNSGLDKDAFLQILVAQMKYQDPLQPTSNTEYVSQLATFSQLEEVQNVSTTVDMQRASGLVGKYVFMKTTDASGNTTFPEGQVDYVVYQNGKAFLSINETLYDLADLDTVADPEYLLASRLNTSFSETLNKLPNPDTLNSESNLTDVKQIIEVYNNMTSYQKTFISADDQKLYDKFVEKYEELVPDEEKDTTEPTEPTEPTE